MKAGDVIENWNKFRRGEKEWEKRAMRETGIRIPKWDEKEEKAQKERIEGREEIVIYSDGSKKGGRVGVGVCRLGKLEEGKGYHMGKSMEIFDAEMIGIKKGIEMGIKCCDKDKTKKHIAICCDSQTAIQRALKREPSKGEFIAYKIRWILDAAKQRNIRVTLEWIKGHTLIPGNLRADELAKQGASKTVKDKDAFMSMSYLESTNKEKTIDNWKKQWITEARKGKHYKLTPKTRHIIKHTPVDRPSRVVAARLRTVHAPLNKYFNKIGKREDAECDCGRGEQTVMHVLEECAFTEGSRKEESKKGICGAHKLLFKKGGGEGLIKIWQEFVAERGKIVRCKDGEDREDGWGWGEVDPG